MSLRSGFVSIVVAAALAAACGKSKSKREEAAPAGAPPDPRVAAIIATSKALRDKACACTDAECSAAVRHEHDQWLAAQIDEYTKLGEPKSTKAQEAEASKAQQELFKCLDKPHAPAPTPPAATR